MMNKNKVDISTVAPLLILLIFGTCIMLVLLFGAKMYNNTLHKNNIAFDRRTIDQYLLTRIRQSDAEQSFFVGTFKNPTANNQGDTLFLAEQIDGELYYTRIYCHDGYLYELFTAAEDIFEPTDGEKIMPMKQIRFTLDGQLLSLYITHTDNSLDTLFLTLRSMEGGTYAE